MAKNLTRAIRSSIVASPKEAPTGRLSCEQRRRQLIEVATHLFSRKGFTGTTTKEIARAARVNEAVIFHHFATKDELYTAILDQKASEVFGSEWLAELHKYAERRDDVGLFREIATKKLAHHCNDHDFLRLMFYSSLEGHGLAHTFLERQVRPVHDFLCSYIARRQREGAFRKLSPVAVVSAFIGMVNQHLIVNTFFPNWKLDITDEEAVTNFTVLILDGLRPKGATRRAPLAPRARKTDSIRK